MSAESTVSVEAGLIAFLHDLPKVELHCHLFGTVRQATFRALAAKTGNVVTPEEIEAEAAHV